MHDPTANTSSSAQLAVDMTAICALLGSMKATYGSMYQSFRALNEQSEQVSKLGPTMDAAKENLIIIRRQIQEHDHSQEGRVAEVRKMIKEEIKVVAGNALRDQIRDQIKLEVAKQVREQMEAQMHEHLPVPLAQQADESRQQIVEVKHACRELARRKNAGLRPSPSNLNDPLEVVLKPDGTKSSLYPANLRSLFAYDNAKARSLLNDFGLHDHGVLEKNLNRFMAHVGIRFELVPVSASNVTSPRTRTADVSPLK
ncbi:hypothetical protein C8T65DRAFT_572214 [Cerioporus squamosus]|nr:hypothetical protein C8T65DRAFT_572214 [Cerioporus squamosus]